MHVDQPAFKPVPGTTVSLAATTVSASAQINPGKFSRHLRIVNTGSVTAFVEFGESGVAATTSAIPILAGSVEIFSVPDQYVAAITASGTAQMYFTPGEGM